MVFSSFQFMLWFLPFCGAVYALASRKGKNLALLFFSIVFYAYGSITTPGYLWLMLASVAVNYICGLFVGRRDRLQKVWLGIGLTWNFGCLFLFKYIDFFLTNLNRLPLIDLPLTELILPLGISFFTFQTVSYLMDVYRGKTSAEYNIIDFATYVLVFPQFLQGPIVRYPEIAKDLHEPRVTVQDIFEGIEMFVIGLGSKVLLADQLGGLWRDLDTLGYDSISTPAAWLGILAYSLQLYFDFSGYSRMAIGLGRMFGFHFPQNFNFPYLSLTMTDFWRRWHMTLGSWFRDYLYIPLGGNRKGKKRMYFNMFVVWTATGFWHGADWNFILWGMLLFVLIALEKAWLGKHLNAHKWLGHLYMIFWIPMSWLLFAVSDLKQIGVYISKLFGFGEPALMPDDYVGYLGTYGKYLLFGLIFCTPLPEILYKRIAKLRYARIIYAVIWLAIIGLSAYPIYIGLNDPFLYARF